MDLNQKEMEWIQNEGKTNGRKVAKPTEPLVDQQKTRSSGKGRFVELTVDSRSAPNRSRGMQAVDDTISSLRVLFMVHSVAGRVLLSCVSAGRVLAGRLSSVSPCLKDDVVVVSRLGAVNERNLTVR